MLLQSHTDEIHLLPAVPEAWANGSVHGMRARGDFVVDMDWKNGALTQAVVHAGENSTGKCVVRYGNKTVTLQLAAGTKKRLTPTSF